jgi:hypothetical protein
MSGRLVFSIPRVSIFGGKGLSLRGLLTYAATHSAGGIPQRPRCTRQNAVLLRKPLTKQDRILSPKDQCLTPNRLLRFTALRRRSILETGDHGALRLSFDFRSFPLLRLSVVALTSPLSAGGLSVVPSEDYSHAPPCYAVFLV